MRGRAIFDVFPLRRLSACYCGWCDFDPSDASAFVQKNQNKAWLVIGTNSRLVGPQFDAFWLYGIVGVNRTLNINFIPVASSQSATVPGGTLGFGGQAHTA